MIKETEMVQLGMDLDKTVLKYLDDKVMNMKVKGTKISVTKEQREAFYAHCIYNKLNPYKGEVYAVPFKNKNGYDIVPITSYKVYLKRAVQSGKFGGFKFESIYEDYSIDEIKKDEKGKYKETGNRVNRREWVGLKMVVNRKDRDLPYEEEGMFIDKAQTYKDHNTGKVIISKMRKDNKMFMLKKQMIREVIPMVFAEFMDDIQDQVEQQVEEHIDIIQGDTIEQALDDIS